jgi:hypothetical protein
MVKSLPPGSEENDSESPDFYRPTHEVQRIISPQERIILQRRKTVGVALLGELILWSLSQFFTSRGVPSVMISRLFLLLIFITGVVLIRLTDRRERLLSFGGITKTVILGVLLVLIDRFVPKPIAILQPSTIVQPTPSPSPFPTQSARQSPTHIFRRSTPTPSATPIPTARELARIGLGAMAINPDDKEHVISVPIVLKNFTNQSTDGTLEPSTYKEDLSTHEVDDRPVPDPPSRIAFGPQQEMTYMFRINSPNQEVYDKIIHGDIVVKCTLKVNYRPTLDEDRTVAYRLVIKLNLKTRVPEILESGWSDK